MAHHHCTYKDEQFVMSERAARWCFLGMGLGVLAFVYALYAAPQRAWINLLIDHFYFLSIALFGTFMLALQSLTRMSWSVPFKRVSMALSGYLPFAFIVGVVLLFGAHSLYEWTHHDVVAADPLLSKKVAYLNMPFFVGRFVGIFFLWILFSKMIVNLSMRQESEKRTDLLGTITKFSAIFLIIFAFSYSMASYDWIMSLEPHWFSTIFAIYTFSGMFVGGLVVMTLAIIILQGMGYLKEVINENHYHDLGKLIFGFSTFWAYIWFSQYLLIWYSNIPEETQYYLLREHNNWDWLFYFNFIINWLVPFLVLLPREAKRNKFVLSRVCIMLLVGRWLDLYILVAPKVYEHGKVLDPQIGLIEVFMALGMAGLFAFVVSKSLAKRSMIPKNDPYLDEGVHLHQ